MREKIRLFICFVMLPVMLSGCSHICAQNKAEHKNHHHAIFKKVIDGDTFESFYHGRIQKIRLADIDCFEVSEGNRLKSQAKKQNISIKQALKKGKESENKLAKLLMYDSIIYVGPIETDRYGRLVAYVYTANNLNVNQYMFYEGSCNAFPEESYYEKSIKTPVKE